MQLTSEHIGRRVQYTATGGAVTFGTIRDVVNKFVDVCIDGMKRPRFYVPEDCVTLLPEEHPEYIGSNF